VKHWLAAYGTAAAILLVLDLGWLGLIARSFYKARIGPLMLDSPNLGVGALFYLAHVAGIVVFALPQASSWTTAMLYGALFGFCVFAAYDFTNLATLRGWPVSVTVVDLAWGTFATAVATTATFVVMREFVD
jgi:uncharacterized membrane protein